MTQEFLLGDNCLSSHVFDSLNLACEIMGESYSRGWISTRDGNVSVRLENSEVVYISPSGVVKHRMEPSQFIEMNSRNSFVEIDSIPQPSGEIELHRIVMSLWGQGQLTVLHLHPTHIVAAMLLGVELQQLADGFPEVARYTRVGRNVPALPATSLELAEAVGRSFNQKLRPHIIGLDRHGVVAVGKNPSEAFEHVERLEHICQIALVSGSLNR